MDEWLHPKEHHGCNYWTGLNISLSVSNRRPRCDICLIILSHNTPTPSWSSIFKRLTGKNWDVIIMFSPETKKWEINTHSLTYIIVYTGIQLQIQRRHRCFSHWNLKMINDFWMAFHSEKCWEYGNHILMKCGLHWRWVFNIFSCFYIFLAATKQLYKWYFPSVTPFWLCSHHCIIMKFSGVITNDQSKVHAKGRSQRSKVKVREVTTQLNCFRTVTQVWIYIWWWNDVYSLMLLRRGALLFFKVICQISRSHGSKNRRIWPKLGVSGL